MLTSRKVHLSSWMAVPLVITLQCLAHAQGGPESMPSAVRKSFEQAYPGAAISSVTRQLNGTVNAVRVDSVDKGRRRVVFYDANGAVLQVDEQVEEKELPAPVAAAMRSHPRASYGGGLKIARGTSVEYHLTLRGTRKTALVVKPDGTVISFK
jgi:hypothetical protein